MAHHLELDNSLSIGADHVESDREYTFSHETWKSEGHFIIQ